ncbi:hypothetical protein RFI_21232 [Reticulomyxa filosa]|uniref:Zinc-finger domain-containing protein n=1 Tax=Reticulomyxa filosa TaxID=46433 RepID=X6MSN8_RETFI|nr:hypothetical protein RFI_21232 [Reticulomyxa filosa]|eukprot:ETO16125.1 hypothetical protein RFI_21232 [Reticulomyxa filosa]
MNLNGFGGRLNASINDGGGGALTKSKKRVAPKIEPDGNTDVINPSQENRAVTLPPKKRRRLMYEFIQGNKSESRFDDTIDASHVKGSCETGYRMILEEPVRKDMLSCHQCKNKKKLDDVIICGHVYMIKHTMKTCTKKYCKSCLLRFYLESPANNKDDPAWPLWKCPCCRFICCCAWCRKKKAKRSEVFVFEHANLSVRANAHRLTPATSLARKLVTETELEDNDTHLRHLENQNCNGSTNNNSRRSLTLPEDFFKQPNQVFVVCFVFNNKLSLSAANGLRFFLIVKCLIVDDKYFFFFSFKKFFRIFAGEILQRNKNRKVSHLLKEKETTERKEKKKKKKEKQK